VNLLYDRLVNFGMMYYVSLYRYILV